MGVGGSATQSQTSESGWRRREYEGLALPDNRRNMDFILWAAGNHDQEDTLLLCMDVPFP